MAFIDELDTFRLQGLGSICTKFQGSKKGPVENFPFRLFSSLTGMDQELSQEVNCLKTCSTHNYEEI